MNPAAHVLFQSLEYQSFRTYELELLTSGSIPQALPLTLLETAGHTMFQITLQPAKQSLRQLDQGVTHNQTLGLRRMISLLEAFRDAKGRLLRPSFSYLSLDLVFLDQEGWHFPILPMAEDAAVRLPIQNPRPDFWWEWTQFYQVQRELGQLGRRLAARGEYAPLQNIYRSYLPPQAAPRSSNKTTGRGSTKPLLAELLRPNRTGLPKEHRRLALLLNDVFILGRDPGLCDLCIRDPWIGRRHARITRVHDHYYLEDLASLNGTTLDGYALWSNEKRLLPEASIISLGKSRLEFRMLGAASTSCQTSGHRHPPVPGQYNNPGSAFHPWPHNR